MSAKQLDVFIGYHLPFCFRLVTRTKVKNGIKNCSSLSVRYPSRWSGLYPGRLAATRHKDHQPRWLSPCFCTADLLVANMSTAISDERRLAKHPRPRWTNRTTVFIGNG